MGAVLAVAPFGGGEGLWRRVIVAVLAVAWSLRLGLHIVRRTLKSGDDPRYANLMADWGPAAPAQLFVFLQAQAAVGAVLRSDCARRAGAGAAALRDVLGIPLMAAAIPARPWPTLSSRASRPIRRTAARSVTSDSGACRATRTMSANSSSGARSRSLLSRRATHAWLALLAPAIMYSTFATPPACRRSRNTCSARARTRLRLTRRRRRCSFRNYGNARETLLKPRSLIPAFGPITWSGPDARLLFCLLKRTVAIGR